MSAANLDAVKKKYKFKEIAVATWRDPSLSVLSARGGPTSSTFSAEGRPYVPTYKVKYSRLPEPTDDEDSGNEGEKGPVHTDAPDQIPDESQILQPQDHEALVESAETEQKLDNPDLVPEESTAVEPEPKLEDDGGLNDESLPFESPDIHEPGPEAVIESQSEVVDVAPSSEPEGGDGIVVNEDKVVEEGQQSEPSTKSPDHIVEPPIAMDTETSDSPTNEEHIDERRVSFAPGTPEPKPTPRKKKAAKGKKKRIAVPFDEVPADILAMIDSSFEGMPPPPPPPPPAAEVPGEGDIPSDDTATEPLAVDDEKSDERIVEDLATIEPNSDVLSKEEHLDALDEQHGGDDQLPAEPQDAAEEIPPASEAAQDEEPSLDLPESVDNGASADPEPPKDDSTFTFSAPAPPDDLDIEKPSKKKSSKSGWDKMKKKSSKSKAKESSPPPAGLGINTGPPPIPDLDDILKDLGPTDEDELALSQGDQVHPGDLSLIPSASPDIEIAGDDSKSDESGLEVPGPTESPESDPSVGEGIEESTNLTETIAEVQPAGEEAVGDAEPPLDPALSPADSGVEFEDGEKDAGEGGRKASSSIAEKLEAEPVDLPEPSDETKGAAEEDQIANDEETSNKDTPIEDEPKGDENESDHQETSTDPEAEGGDELQTLDQKEDLPIVNDDPISIVEADDNPETGGAADSGPPDESKDEATGEDALAGDVVDEGGEAEPAEQEAVLPAADDLKDLSEPETEATLDGAEPETPAPEPVTEIVEPELPEPDPFIEAVEAEVPQPEAIHEEIMPEASKSIDEAIVEEGPTEEAPIVEEVVPKDEGSNLEAPPSPNLSKTSSGSSRKNKATHWARKHEDNVLNNVLKDVFEDKSLTSKKSKKGGKEEVFHRDRGSNSRRLSNPEEDEARRTRRKLRKLQEAARLVEEERRKTEEYKLQQLRREERKAARKADDEQRRAARKVDDKIDEKIRRLEEERESIRAKHRGDDARRRRHHDHERERERPTSSSHREVKDTGPALRLPTLALPKALDFANAQSHKGKQPRYADELPPTSSHRPKETARHDHPKDPAKEEVARPSSSSGGKSHHRPRHHRSESDKSSRSHKDSDHRPRRLAEVEEDRPKTLFGMLRLR